MRDRVNSSEIFMDYLTQSVKKSRVKIYGIIDTNQDTHKLGFVNSYVYQKVILETSGLVKDIHLSNDSSDAYKTLLEDISNNIHSSLIERLGLNSVPERISSITLGSLDNKGNFVSKKVLNKDEYMLKNGKISLIEVEAVGEYTHAKIDYYAVKTIE